MEYFKAPDLYKQLNQCFKKEEIVSITQQILLALTELDVVIHGDLKPSNILSGSGERHSQVGRFWIGSTRRCSRKSHRDPSALLSSSRSGFGSTL